MNNYIIEHKIETLSKCAVNDDVVSTRYSFAVDDITFEPWEFNFRDGIVGDAWIAKGEISATNLVEAINFFRKKLRKIIPRISLVGQCFIEYQFEPFLAYKTNNEFAYFYYTSDRPATGLMFIEGEKKALGELLATQSILEEFYYYWNDAVNTVGYCPKLLVMCSALESLVKKNGKKDFNLLENILGKELKEELFGTKQNSRQGLRHRLVHAEYFNFPGDSQKNYVEEIHGKVIAYFNTKILSTPLISEQVIHPQRHPFRNRMQWRGFIKKLMNKPFDLRDVLVEFDIRNGWRNEEKYTDNFDSSELMETY